MRAAGPWRFVVGGFVALAVACGDDGGDGDGDGSRAAGVPATYDAYCAELGEVYCQREEDCDPGSMDACLRGFRTGCCERENTCASGFGEGVSSADYQACIDDTNDGQCGSQAPASCRAVVAQQPPAEGSGPPTLEQACADSCYAQAETNCSGVFPPSTCIDACLQLPETLPECTDAWIAINACMGDAPLFCDTVNGGAAVSSEHCGPEIEAFMEC